MRINTPRATPVVRAPMPSAPPPGDLRDRPPLMRAPVSIITPVSEVELREGSILAGRLPECDVMIDDGLVSRMHARISVREDSVVVEDLHSTNGVYVNGIRITHSALLREGDRLLLGTTEISLFEARPDARVAPLRARRHDHDRSVTVSPPSPRLPLPPTLPADARRSFGKLELNLDELAVADGDDGPPSARSAELMSLRSRASSAPSTARADALEVIGALAERLAANGNLDEARRVLSAHLKRILQGATAGLTVPEEVCLLASRYALSLSLWTGQSAWIDYVVELHLASRRAMHPDTFTMFEGAVLSHCELDRQLFTYYVDGLRGERGLLTVEERHVLDRLIILSEN
jgi:pSer/pThr/pTyr-binding forkhead associated (FHA) protein